MLILSRKVGEQITIGDHITLMITRIQGDRVRVGIKAPKEIPVHRGEIFATIQKEYVPLVEPLGCDNCEEGYFQETPGGRFQPCKSCWDKRHRVEPNDNYTPERLLNEKLDSHREE
jgi:carbon storage regulator